MTKSGAITMENGDWAKFQSLMEAAIKPLQNAIDGVKADVKENRREFKESIKDLPCDTNTIKLTQIETRETSGLEHEKDTRTIIRNNKNFTFKAIVIAISIVAALSVLAGALHAMGIFKAIAK